MVCTPCVITNKAESCSDKHYNNRWYSVFSSYGVEKSRYQGVVSNLRCFYTDQCHHLLKHLVEHTWKIKKKCFQYTVHTIMQKKTTTTTENRHGSDFNKSKEKLLVSVWQHNIKWASSRENLSSGFATKVNSNRLVQPQKLGRGLKFRI